MNTTTARKQTSFKEVIEAHTELKKHSGNTEMYHKEREKFVPVLASYVNYITKEQINELTKEQFIDVLQLCSTFRPMALHSILLSLSKTSKYY